MTLSPHEDNVNSLLTSFLRARHVTLGNRRASALRARAMQHERPFWSGGVMCYRRSTGLYQCSGRCRGAYKSGPSPNRVDGRWYAAARTRSYSGAMACVAPGAAVKKRVNGVRRFRASAQAGRVINIVRPVAPSRNRLTASAIRGACTIVTSLWRMVWSSAPPVQRRRQQAG